MDRETHPNAVYRYDPNSQIIYPVDKQTNEPIAEISKYVMKQEIPTKPISEGMIQNLKLVKLDGTSKNTDYKDNRNDELSIDDFGYSQSKHVQCYADFVVNVFAYQKKEQV